MSIKFCNAVISYIGVGGWGLGGTSNVSDFLRLSTYRYIPVYRYSDFVHGWPYYLNFTSFFNSKLRTRAFEESLKDDDDDDYDEKEQTTKKDASPRSKSPVNNKGKHAGRGQSSQSGKSRARPSTRETSRSKTPTKTEASKPEREDDVASKPTPATLQTEQKEESSDTSESDQNYSGKNIHREGYDRPLSRLGHIPEGISIQND